MFDLSEFEYVLTALATRMVPPDSYRDPSSERGKVVFLLGAGCSRQYGLPSFAELLTYLWEDYLRRVPKPPVSLELLRDKLDKFWQAQGPEDRRRMLDFYLGRVHGGICPGYLQLAHLAASGHVKAIVNMNFDSLLEDALDKVYPKYRVATSFLVHDKDKLMVYKPHGTIGKIEPAEVLPSRGPARPRNELILDIANSDLFTDPDEQQAAQELLTGYDVVSVGYSGVDAKIAAALRAFSPGRDPKDRKLFVVNASRPDPRLLLVMAERASQDLLISGEDAAFENFMLHLSDRVGRWKKGVSFDDSLEPSQTNLNFMTSAEREALKECLRMALDIRLSMNIAEQSKTSIQDHGYEIFNTCLNLAKHAGICLSPPEKYLLHCAAFLHDLGYYRGYTRAKAGQYPGWRLLRMHGTLTEELLREKFQEDPASLDLITPKSYKQVDGGPSFEDLLCSLCAAHSGLVEPAEIEDGNLIVAGAEVPVRFSLLVTLFAVAEDLSEGHPFFPSADPVGPSRRKEAEGSDREEAKDTWAIVDPVLDLYLHQARPILFDPKRRRITVTRRSEARDEERPATVEWLLTMAAGHIKRFDLAAQKAGGWGIELVCDTVPELPKSMEMKDLLACYESLLCGTLAENFSLALRRIEEGSIGEMASIIDLVSIYTMSTPVTDRPEPRIALVPDRAEPSVLNQALARVQRRARRKQFLPATDLFAVYLSCKRSGRKSWSAMDRVFMGSYDEILLPASRFFGRNWHDGIESTLMARICFDMGYSPFRSEVMSGLRNLMEEKVFPGAVDGQAHAHNRCTICTSRLLYIFTHAKRLIPQEQLDRYAKGLESTIASILRYMIDLDPAHEIWWGLQPDAHHKGQIKSAEYLAWAARAATFCLSLDLELRKRRVDKDWLGQKCGLDRARVERLVRERWDQLLSADRDREGLLSPLAEEPHSFVFGHVALALLGLQRLDPEIRNMAVGGREEEIASFTEALRGAADKIGILSQLSGFFLWPLKLLLDSLGDIRAAEDAVNLCYSCIESPVWITTGADAGSWGFNVKNTQTIATSLMAFWQYVFEGDGQRQARFRDLFDSKERQKKAAAAR